LLRVYLKRGPLYSVTSTEIITSIEKVKLFYSGRLSLSNIWSAEFKLGVTVVILPSFTTLTWLELLLTTTRELSVLRESAIFSVLPVTPLSDTDMFTQCWEVLVEEMLKVRGKPGAQVRRNNATILSIVEIFFNKIVISRLSIMED